MNITDYVLNKLYDMEEMREAGDEGKFLCRCEHTRALSLENCYTEGDILVLGFTDGTTQSVKISDFYVDWDKLKFEVEDDNGDMVYLY